MPFRPGPSLCCSRLEPSALVPDHVRRVVICLEAEIRLHASQGGTVEIEAHGTNFDCSRLTETDGPGTLVLPFPAVETVVGDTANVLILAD